MAIAQEDFQYLATLIKTRSGIALSEDKDYLIESRLLPIVRSKQLKDISDLVTTLKKSPDSAIIRDIIEAMTTNETSFFRDIKPFQQLKEHVIPDIASRFGATKEIHVWSAAASSGQEAYSLSILWNEEKAKYSGASFRITGTDLDTKILEIAKAGIYTQFEVQRGLAITQLVKYFTQVGEKWHAKKELTDICRFQQFNLLDPYTGLGPFDLVLCRNVLIYFDIATKKAILEKIANVLRPKGILFLGSSETLTDLSTRFELFKNIQGVYQLK